MPPHTHFSTKSIKLLADDIHSNFAAASVDHFLTTLANIDSQIHQQFNVFKSDLAASQAALQAANAKCDALQLDNVRYKAQLSALQSELCSVQPSKQPHQPPEPCSCATADPSAPAPPKNRLHTGLAADHLPSCALRIAALANCTPHRLVQLLIARERAFTNQQALVHRLKLDNADLKTTYNNLLTRYQQKQHSASNALPAHNIHRLSQQIQHAGQTACQVASEVEQRLQITARNLTTFRQSVAPSAPSAPPPTQSTHRIKDEYDNESDAEHDSHATACVAAADQLISTLAAQKVAHERLRNTVVQLTSELESVAQNKKNDTQLLSEKLSTTHSKLAEKDSQIADLKKQLNKVLAEYQAISVAHSYSNAELSRIRANNRAKTKDRQFNDRHDRHDRYDRPHGLINGAENRLHHRKIHFR
ncbi:hypothetical protein BWQ96_05081 [Gracilariopsis chorda]|uniref:Uncharacterized protein n=1 Tax=Gracilariopsis chorda TaxID=448386 RepID=A0A2V3IVL7_9FLOR|nr:hypothetical protein BWQ96_05081 [Gracilariopsis chorda]|eukprot:PXF45180.1 hypothetical protein BWQ96_05081 [Gracilariopsis chorda]